MQLFSSMMASIMKSEARTDCLVCVFSFLSEGSLLTVLIQLLSITGTKIFQMRTVFVQLHFCRFFFEFWLISRIIFDMGCFSFSLRRASFIDVM